jgi:hypothetical protein
MRIVANPAEQTIAPTSMRNETAGEEEKQHRYEQTAGGQ